MRVWGGKEEPFRVRNDVKFGINRVKIMVLVNKHKQLLFSISFFCFNFLSLKIKQNKGPKPLK